jgi:hypothetical protein
MTLHIVGEYDRKVLFSLLCAYKILNPIHANERGLSNFTSHNSQITSLYDVMENDNDMTLSVMKEQFNHFRIRKSIKKNTKIHWHGGEPQGAIFLCRVC